jgi:hypothetical protein
MSPFPRFSRTNVLKARLAEGAMMSCEGGHAQHLYYNLFETAFQVVAASAADCRLLL